MSEIDPGHFTEANAAVVACARNANATSERFKVIMALVTRHLHPAIDETEPTQDEWMQAILCLSETDQQCVA